MSHRCGLIFGASIVLHLWCTGASWSQEIVLRLNFDDLPALGEDKVIWPEEWRFWPGEGFSLVESPTGQSLKVELPVGARESGRYLRMPLSAKEIAGKRLRVFASVRAENVSPPPQPWNGVKCMLQLVGQTDTRWPQNRLPGGSWEWQKVAYTCEVPPDCIEAFLVLGLEQVTGTAWFDDIQIDVIGTRRQTPPVHEVGPPYKGHALPRLRGTMIGPKVTNADLRELATVWGANHIRWQLIWGGFPHGPADQASVEEYRQWLESALRKLEEALPVCREVGLLVAIDLHTPPGGRNAEAECRLFHDKIFQQAFLEIWEEMAGRFRHEPAVWGYDLLNEPVEGVVPDGLMNWQELAQEVAHRIRAIDPHHAIIVEPPSWGNPDALDWFEPLTVPGVVYSVHMYIPHRFTHQGIHGNPLGVIYPGEIDGRYYDRKVLEAVLEPVVRFQRDYNAHIYIGEFSAIRWAPGDSAYQYLRDCIEIFEAHDWDWAYHAFREWHGWSVEHGSDPKQTAPVPFLTDRAQLLRAWFAKNEKPRF